MPRGLAQNSKTTAARLLSQTAQRVLARTVASKFFRTPALPSEWQGIRHVRTISVPGGPIGLRLWPRDDETQTGAVVKGFVSVPRPAGSGHVEAKTHTRSGSNPSPVMLAGIAVGAELLGIGDVQVGTMPYDDIMNILRARAQERKDLHFRRPPPREGSFTGVASFARRAAVADGHTSHHLHQRVTPEVKAGTTINVQVRPGQLGVRLRPANAARGVGAVVWQFVNIQIEHPGGVREFVESPIQQAGVVPGMQLVALDSDRTDDMNHDRIMAMLHEREHQAKCLTFKAATGLRRQASTAASAMKDLDSDDEDLPVARSRKKRVFHAVAARSPAGSTNAATRPHLARLAPGDIGNDDDYYSDDTGSEDGGSDKASVISDVGSTSDRSMDSEEESFETRGAERGADDNIDDLLGLVSM